AHDALLESTSSKPYEESISQVPEGSGNPNPTASAFIPPVDQMETLTVESPISTVNSPVPTACLNDSLEPSNEPASPMRDDSQGEACPTDSGFIADQDRATIAMSSTLPHDSAARVTSPAADEGKDREAVASKPSGEDAPIKGKSNNKGEAAAERISNDSKEIARVLTFIDAATLLEGETNVPTGSGFIPTAGPPATVIFTGSEVGPTASLIVRRRKGKEVMVESDTPKKKTLQEQIDVQVAIELEEQ
nr:hypothetical protein [Tanacetum cinerariifolium]